MKILAINCKPIDISYFTNRGLNLDVTYETLPNPNFPIVLHATINGVSYYKPDIEPYLIERFKTFQYSIIIVGYNTTDGNYPNDTTGGTTNLTPLPCGTFFCSIKQNDQYTNSYAIHELHHAIVKVVRKTKWIQDYMDYDSQGRPYYLNDQPENPLSNHAQTWNQIKPYLSVLNAITYQTMPPTQTYKYFKPSEIVGLKPEFVALLDKARGIAGVPFKITSGFRTPAQNASVGGVQDSAHETGLACDLAVSDSVTGGKILLALAQVGFKRFGFYGDNHIHVDMDSTKPTPCYWIK
jgi:hypothetical protein